MHHSYLYTHTHTHTHIIDYAITVVPIFPLCLPPPSTSHPLRQSPHHCSCPWVMCISSLATPFPILYFISLWLLSNYLFVLLHPLTSSPILPHPLPSGSHPYALCIVCLCSSCLLSLFLDSVVDRYVFIVILLFIFLIIL